MAHPAMAVESPERNAAYTAARATLQSLGLATRAWPREIAELAKGAADRSLGAIVEALARHPTSAARRQSLRRAMFLSLELTAVLDVAMAQGLGNAAMEEALRCASRTLSMLGMSFHATAWHLD